MYGFFPSPIVLPCGCSASRHCHEAQRLAEDALAGLTETIAARLPCREGAPSRAARGRYYAHRGELVPAPVRAAFEEGPVRNLQADLDACIFVPDPRVREIECSVCGELADIEVGRKMCPSCRSERRREARQAAREKAAAPVIAA